MQESVRLDMVYEHDAHQIVTSVVALAGVIGLKGEPERAARLFGAAEAAIDSIGVGLQSTDQPEYERDLAVIRTRLDEATFAALWAEGREMSLEEAVRLALGE